MKKTLIVVDMQKDFIDGSLGTKEAQGIVENVRKKIARYRDSGDTIIFTRDTHSENYLETSEGKKLPVKHCIEGTEGWNIDSRIEVLDSIVIDKPTFGWTKWKQTEQEHGLQFERIELIGLCTDICVVSNALLLKALYPDAEIIVDANCCAGVTPDSHEAALVTMKMCQIEVVGA